MVFNQTRRPKIELRFAYVGTGVRLCRDSSPVARKAKPFRSSNLLVTSPQGDARPAGPSLSMPTPPNRQINYVLPVAERTRIQTASQALPSCQGLNGEERYNDSGVLSGSLLITASAGPGVSLRMKAKRIPLSPVAVPSPQRLRLGISEPILHHKGWNDSYSCGYLVSTDDLPGRWFSFFRWTSPLRQSGHACRLRDI